MPRESSYERKARIAHQKHFLKIAGKDFQKALGKVRRYTMLSRERLYDIYNSIGYIAANKVPGAIVEIGCWGGGALGLSYWALRKNKLKREIYGYDTFEGHPRPSKKDIDIWGQSQIKRFKQHEKSKRGWAKITLPTVIKNLKNMQVDQKHVKLVKGMVEISAKRICPQKISLLRIDVDWYKPTLFALSNFYPKLSRGGVLIVDDFGHYRGCEKALRKYFKKRMPRYVHIDYSCIALIKSPD
jgi:O-methyltransferase